MPINNKEIRSFSFKIKEDKTEQIKLFEDRKMVGHAAIFGEATDIGGWFLEQIEPGAFKASIKKDDIRALFNHNPDFVLGRNTAGTLKMKEDKDGLKVEIDPPDTQVARDLVVSIERGDISQMSFAFQVLEEEWIRAEKPKDLDLRKIKKVRLYDVSPVTFPAYEGTDIAVRSHEAWKKEQETAEEPAIEEPPATPEHDNTPYLRRQQLLRRY